MRNIDWFSSDVPKFNRQQPAKIAFHRTFEEVKPKEYVIDGFLAKGETSCVFGEPGATKSAFVADIACHVAGGLSWMGRGAGVYDPPHELRGEMQPEQWFPGSVLYVALERGGQVQRRVEAFSKDRNLQEPLNLAIHPGPLDFVGDDSDRLTQIVIDAEDQSATMEYEDHEGDGFSIDLIIIDTLARTMGSGSDSGGEETAKIARHLERTLKWTGAHIMIVHHTPIGDDSRLRGHGNLLAALDMTIRVKKGKNGSTATVIKDNDTAEDQKPKFAYTLKSVVIGKEARSGRETVAPVLVPAAGNVVGLVDLPEPAEDKPSLTDGQQQAFDALESCGPDPVNEEAWRSAYDLKAGKELKAPARKMRFHRAKEALTTKGLISCSQDKLWSVTA